MAVIASKTIVLPKIPVTIGFSCEKGANYTDDPMNYAYIRLPDGTLGHFESGIAATKVTLKQGDIIICYVKSGSNSFPGTVKVNGETVFSNAEETVKSYKYTVVDDAHITISIVSASSAGYRGSITITEGTT